MALGGELRHCRSKDGTRIGVERLGDGPPLVAVHGGTADRSRWAPVAEALGQRFTLHLLDRRGRGDSRAEAGGGYSIDLETQDLLAVIEDVGEPVALLGHSYGGMLGLTALPHTDRITAALLYEPAYGPRVMPPGVLERIDELVRAGQREAALETFYRDVVAIDPTPLKQLPIWQARIAAVHTIVREGAALDYRPEAADFAEVTTPVRVLLGTLSPAPFRDAAERTVEVVPGADLVELEGQGHAMIDADPPGFVDQVVAFLGTRV